MDAIKFIGWALIIAAAYQRVGTSLGLPPMNELQQTWNQSVQTNDSSKPSPKPGN